MKVVFNLGQKLIFVGVFFVTFWYHKLFSVSLGDLGLSLIFIGFLLEMSGKRFLSRRCERKTLFLPVSILFGIFLSGIFNYDQSYFSFPDFVGSTLRISLCLCLFILSSFKTLTVFVSRKFSILLNWTFFFHFGGFFISYVAYDLFSFKLLNVTRSIKFGGFYNEPAHYVISSFLLFLLINIHPRSSVREKYFTWFLFVTGAFFTSSLGGKILALGSVLLMFLQGVHLNNLKVKCWEKTLVVLYLVYFVLSGVLGISFNLTTFENRTAQGRFERILENKDQSFRERFVVSTNILLDVSSSHLFGVGVGNHKNYILTNIEKYPEKIEKTGTHLIFYTFAVSLGTVFLIPYLLLLLVSAGSFSLFLFLVAVWCYIGSAWIGMFWVVPLIMHQLSLNKREAKVYSS